MFRIIFPILNLNKRILNTKNLNFTSSFIRKCSDSKKEDRFNAVFDDIREHKVKTRAVEKIDKETLLLLERLSLVNIEDEEALKVLQDAIEFASQILDIDTEGVEPLYTVLENEKQRLREDIPFTHNTQQEILANAAETEEEYFVAPPGNIALEHDVFDEPEDPEEFDKKKTKKDS
uniref:Glutamyl-tRNA(Gln) amidotransferase subunit C, mitochondrial n=1 Tax=Culicoides sonorensis TaxID=179676 RepID=A0A336MEY1_CULSO